MSMATAPNDYQLLVSIANSLRSEYVDPAHDPWAGSPFAWIKQRPSRQVGKIGEQLIAGWAAARDCDVVKSPDSEADRMINGRRTEIKFSTLWESGVYKFQQIRNQRYEYIVCLGLSPHAGHCWVIPKAHLVTHRFRLNGLVHQHGGRAGRDTWWLSFRAENPPKWLKEFGGELSTAMNLIKEL